MANEASVSWSLSVNKDNLAYSQQKSFQADVSEARGIAPGLVLATVAGVNVDLSLLGTPGLAAIINLSEDYTVVVGIKDTSTGVFHPFMDILPGEGFPVRLSQYIEQEVESSAGTGTAGSGSTLFVKSVGGSAYVRVEVVEK